MDAPPVNPRLTGKRRLAEDHNHRKPTQRPISAAELAYAEEFVKTGGDAKAAMVVAKKLGDPEPATISKRTPVRELLLKAFEKYGLTIENIVKAHVKQLRARKAILVDGKVKYVQDGPTRQKAIADAYHVHGAFEAPGEKAGYGSIILHLKPEDRIVIERMRGEPLPAGSFIDVLPEEVKADDSAHNSA